MLSVMRSRDPHQQTSVSRPTRGQAEVVAIVLLLGLIAIAAISVLVVGQSALSSTQEDAELEQVEQAFVQLSHEMASATASGDMSKTVDLDVGDSGAVSRTDAGTITIEARGLGENDTKEIDLGAIEYEHDDGSVVAYQAGGVWSERGNETRMLSTPPIHYDYLSQTLALPLTDVSEERDLRSGSVSITRKNAYSHTDATTVRDDNVNLTIESPYYRGWEQFFRSSAGNGAIQSVEPIDDENGIVKVRLGFHDLSDATARGATLGAGDDALGGNHHEDLVGDAGTGKQMIEMDEVIDHMVEHAKNDTDVESLDPVSSPFDEGTYFTDSFDGEETYEFNLSDGNVTVVIDDDVDLDGGEIRVIDRDDANNNVLKIYSSGDKLAMAGDIHADGDVTAIQFYGPSTMATEMGPGHEGTFEGLLYTATGGHVHDWDLDTHAQCQENPQLNMQAADSTLTGAFVGHSICAHSSAPDGVIYDAAIGEIELDPYPDGFNIPPPITFLNVVEYELDVDNE